MNDVPDLRHLARAVATLIVLATCAVTACSPSDDRRPAQPTAQEAAQFGELALPPGAEVLGVATDGAIDTRYRLALRMNASQLTEFLTQSHFTGDVRSLDRGRERQTIGGPPLSASTDLRYAQDRIDTEAHGTVTREVIEDRHSPDEIYVHVDLVTT